MLRWGPTTSQRSSLLTHSILHSLSSLNYFAPSPPGSSLRFQRSDKYIPRQSSSGRTSAGALLHLCCRAWSACCKGVWGHQCRSPQKNWFSSHNRKFSPICSGIVGFHGVSHGRQYFLWSRSPGAVFHHNLFISPSMILLHLRGQI